MIDNAVSGNYLAVKLSDGSGNAITSTGGKLSVDTEVSLTGEVQIANPVIVSGIVDSLPAGTNNIGVNNARI